MNLNQWFDWRGFGFAILLCAVCASIASLTYFGLSYMAGGHPVSSVPATFAQTLSGLTHDVNDGSVQGSATTTPERVINMLTIADAVPQTGKFLAADLVNMNMLLYQDGKTVAEYPILTKGKPGSPYETPGGFYSILYKEPDHLNKKEKVHMPFSMQFYGNYFIHGWPYYEDGTPVASTYSGGCIRLSTNDAEKVYAFADSGTGLFVYDPIRKSSVPTLVLGAVAAPAVSAESYLVADVDTGDVYLERNAEEPRPIASLTKLMTALVANETIMFNDDVHVASGELLHATGSPAGVTETFTVGDLLYPLLMESNNAVADRLATYHGSSNFVGWMNTTAKALDMLSTHYADASGVSADNVSTTDDLYRLASYIANKKSFIWNITRTPTKTVFADSGTAYQFNNFNIFSSSPDFIGGKVGKTGAAQETMTSLFSVPVNGATRRVAIIVLKSDDYTSDTTKLSDWFTQSADKGVALSGSACVSCLTAPQYRKILP